MSQEESAARQERLLAEQACANAIFRKQWHEAIMLALQLEQVRVCASALFCAWYLCLQLQIEVACHKTWFVNVL